MSIPHNNLGVKAEVCFKRILWPQPQEPTHTIKVQYTDLDRAYLLMNSCHLLENNEDQEFGKQDQEFWGEGGQNVQLTNKKAQLDQLISQKIDWEYIKNKYISVANILVEYHRQAIDRIIINQIQFSTKLLDELMNYQIFSDHSVDNLIVKTLAFDFSPNMRKIKVVYEFYIDHIISDNMAWDYPQIPSMLFVEAIIQKTNDSYNAIIIGYRIFNHNYISRYLDH